jgi:hypothetical protein
MTTARRRGVILMVVLALLTLFAIVGISFVLYAQAEADSSRIFREAEYPGFAGSYQGGGNSGNGGNGGNGGNIGFGGGNGGGFGGGCGSGGGIYPPPDIYTDTLLRYMLGQLIYDVDDTAGVGSSIRGNSLGRGEYGNNDLRTTWVIPPQPPLQPKPIPIPNVLVPNLLPFNGPGRMASQTTPFAGVQIVGPGGQPMTVTDNMLMNHMYFAQDKFLRDPDRYGTRPGLPPVPLPGQQPIDNRGPLTGGVNVPYTYPDLNNIYLGAVTANGQVLMPSFHRPWLFGAIDPTTQQPLLPTGQPNPNFNPNWTNAVGKYLTCMVRPADHYFNGLPSGFPYPSDAGGHVKNLWWLPGPNDSVWMDLGFPVSTAADGTQFKPLFALLVIDLDNRVNINTHGNIRGTDPTTGQILHLSNQGWNKTEVSLSQVLPATSLNLKNQPVPEWPNIFVGINPPIDPKLGLPQPSPSIRGKYGWDGIPNVNNPSVGVGKLPHVYAQADFDGGDDTKLPPLPNGLPVWVQTSPYALPALANNTGASCFPIYNPGYGDGTTNERLVHPVLFDVNMPYQAPYPPPSPPGPPWPWNWNWASDRTFSVSEMQGLLNGGYGIGSPPLTSELGLLLPLNLSNNSGLTPQIQAANAAASFKRRNLITTISWDLSRPGIMPWLFDRNASQYGVYTLNMPPQQGQQPPQLGQPTPDSLAPTGPAVNFPDPGVLRLGTLQYPGVPANSDFRTPGQPAYLPSPPPAQNTLNLNIDWRANDTPLGRINLNRYLQPYPNGARFDDGGALQAQFLLAQSDRQNLANDIYRRLLAVCGVQNPVNPAAPTDLELMPRRWLAQLAVNIVDLIDEDNISTPFNFYTLQDSGNDPRYNPAAIDAVVNPLTPQNELLRYWVFGTELPKVVLNEALVEYASPAQLPKQGTITVPVNVWVELFNTMPDPNANPYPTTVDQTDGNPIPFIIAPGVAPSQANPILPYQVVLANTVAANTGGPLAARPLNPLQPNGPFNSDNVLGTYDTLRSMTDPPMTRPPTPGAPGFTNAMQQWNGTALVKAGNGIPALAPQKFMLIGPSTNPWDARGTMPKSLPAGSNVLQTDAMTIPVTVDQFGKYTPEDRGAAKGLTVVLRRLANPFMPYNPAMINANTGNFDPTFNPYITIDYMENLVLNDFTNVAAYASMGKIQPYASYLSANANSQVIAQGMIPNNIPKAGLTLQTFGKPNYQGQGNNGQPAAIAYDWLCHFDRQLISPVELLQVSGYHPHELTHRFMQGNGPGNRFAHRAPWFDQRTRLYRLWEYLEVGDNCAGISPNGRRPGRININTVWDYETLLALCDPQPANYFTAAEIYDPTWVQPAGPPPGPLFNPNTLYGKLLSVRSPGLMTGAGLGPNDRPFMGMAPGYIPTTNDPFVPAGDAMFPSGSGINNSYLRTDPTAQPDPSGAGAPLAQRLFGNAQALGHPYLKHEMLNKIYNNLTSRSNCFAVWCTVGFFQVLDSTTTPPTLGAEIGSTTGCNIRHRFFAVVDRSEMTIAPAVVTSVINPPVPPLFLIDLTQPGTGAVNATGSQWLQVYADPLLSQYTAGTTPFNGSLTGIVFPWRAGASAVQWNIAPGTMLLVDQGSPREELVMVTGVFQGTALNPAPPGAPNLPPVPINPPGLPTWIQATFIRTHYQGTNLTIMGNPGPQPFFDYYDFGFTPVVPVARTLQ